MTPVIDHAAPLEQEPVPAPTFTSERLHYQTWPEAGRLHVRVQSWQLEPFDSGDLIRWTFETVGAIKCPALTFTSGRAWRPGNNLDSLLLVLDYPRNDEMVRRLDPDWLVGIELYITVTYTLDKPTGNSSMVAMPTETAPTRNTHRPWEAPPKPKWEHNGPRFVNMPGQPKLPPATVNDTNDYIFDHRIEHRPIGT